MEFGPGVNILYGPNGSGKTALLEAIFVLCLGRSHRGATDSVMVHKSQEVYRIEGEIEADKQKYHMAVAYQLKGRKKVTQDKVAIRIQELYEIFSVVSAGPEDSNILSGPPSARRSFIDIYLSQLSTSYLDSLSKYHRVLGQKNAALKQAIDPGPYNILLVQDGAEVMWQRHKFLQKLNETTAQYYQSITEGGKMRLKYKPSFGHPSEFADIETIRQSFEGSIHENSRREALLQGSLTGPHRDEITFEIEGLAAREHGSQGEWRTAAVALKLAVYHMLKEQRNSQPILLLDEIFAELDNRRIKGLIDCFGEFGQLFLTTAQPPPALLSEKARNFEILDGAVTGG